MTKKLLLAKESLRALSLSQAYQVFGGTDVDSAACLTDGVCPSHACESRTCPPTTPTRDCPSVNCGIVSDQGSCKTACIEGPL